MQSKLGLKVDNVRRIPKQNRAASYREAERWSPSSSAAIELHNSPQAVVVRHIGMEQPDKDMTEAAEFQHQVTTETASGSGGLGELQELIDKAHAKISSKIVELSVSRWEI